MLDDQAAAIALMANPGTHGGRPLERIETHGANVFLAGDRAYKLKRAVRYPFMDFSTAARRRRFACREVELNRRTAPELYLGVAPIRRAETGELRLGAVGAALDQAVEAVVVMRRFDQDRVFDRLARAGRLTPEIMADLAARIAEFHLAQAPRRDVDLGARMRWVAADNIAEMKDFPAVFATAEVDGIQAASRVEIERLGPALDGRARDGFVRPCHGDLHLRNIALIHGRPVLFDCVEFNDDLAVIDVAYDLAFLLMDLEHRGRGDLANLVLNRYLERTGDTGALPPLPFYLSLRAAIRAKVAAVTAAERHREARSYFELARALLRPRAPRLVVVAGLSGSGKSTLARGLAPALGDPPGALVLRSDVIRKRLSGVAPTTPLGAAGYGPDITARTYAELGRQAEAALAAGFAVVIDAVSARPSERAAFEHLARRRGVPCRGLWLTAPPAALLRRVGTRQGDASDAGPEVVRAQLDYDIGALDWPRIDASGTPAETLARARRQVAG